MVKRSTTWEKISTEFLLMGKVEIKFHFRFISQLKITKTGESMPEYKKCPYCSEEILADAKKCKHCGEYLDESLKEKATPKETTVVAKEGCFLQTLNVGCVMTIIIIGVIVLLIIIAGLSR